MEQTLQDVLNELNKHNRPASRRQLYRWLNSLDIHPLGARQRPQRYPATTSKQVLAHLGLTNGHGRSTRILSLAEIKRRAGKKDKSK